MILVVGVVVESVTSGTRSSPTCQLRLVQLDSLFLNCLEKSFVTTPLSLTASLTCGQKGRNCVPLLWHARPPTLIDVIG